MLVVQTPVAEVLAIVGEDPVLGFTDSRASPLHRVLAGKLVLAILPNQEWAAGGKSIDGDFFHRAAVARSRQTSVVHDFAVANVDAMVPIPQARRDEVCAKGERAFLMGAPIGGADHNRAVVTRELMLERIVHDAGPRSWRGSASRLDCSL